MNLFIGCSSNNEVKESVKEKVKELSNIISKNNDLVFGCSNNGLMRIIYNDFKKNNRKIYGVCYKIYENLLEDLELDEVSIVDDLGESTIIRKSDNIIFLPGAYGTMSELITALELKRTNIFKGKIILYNIDNFFDDFISFCNKFYSFGCTQNSLKELCYVLGNKEDIINLL